MLPHRVICTDLPLDFVLFLFFNLLTVSQWNPQEWYRSAESAVAQLVSSERIDKIARIDRSVLLLLALDLKVCHRHPLSLSFAKFCRCLSIKKLSMFSHILWRDTWRDGSRSAYVPKSILLSKAFTFSSVGSGIISHHSPPQP